MKYLFNFFRAKVLMNVFQKIIFSGIAVSLIVFLNSCAFIPQNDPQVSIAINPQIFSSRVVNEDFKLVGAIMVFDVNDPLFVFYRDFSENLRIESEEEDSELVLLLYTEENGKGIFAAFDPDPQDPENPENQFTIIPSPFFPPGKYFEINIPISQNPTDPIVIGQVSVPANRQLRAIIHLFMDENIPTRYGELLPTPSNEDNVKPYFMIHFLNTQTVIVPPNGNAEFVFDFEILEGNENPPIGAGAVVIFYPDPDEENLIQD